MNLKPMLAASLDDVDLSTLRYPLLASPKLDGVRCLVWEGVAYSRNAKPIRNVFVQAWARGHHNLDGELIVGEPTAPGAFNTTQSGVMSADGEPDFRFHLFDHVQEGLGFEDRLGFIRTESRLSQGAERIQRVPHVRAHNVVQLLKIEEEYLGLGYEGVMLRDPNGPYKHGRSTLKEGYLLKLKRFIDGEARVLRIEEAEANTNEAFADELGRTKRSSAQAGKVGKGMVGALVVKDPTWGAMRLSPGTMPHSERVAHWANGGRSLVGATVHWRAFGYGVKDRPRFPRYYGVRLDLV